MGFQFFGELVKIIISNNVETFHIMKFINVFLVLTFLFVFYLLLAIFRPMRHRTGGYRPDLGPYVRHGGGPYHPGVLY